jgi:kinesin family member 12
MMPHET